MRISDWSSDVCSSDLDVDSLESRTSDFEKHANVAAIFLNHGKPFKVGERLVQKDLAHTLELIAKGGTKAFYEGPIAHAVVKGSDANGGILALRAFADHTAQGEKPKTGRGWGGEKGGR